MSDADWTIRTMKSPFNPPQMKIRPRGIVSLGDLDNGRILVMARDSNIYVYDKATLSSMGPRLTDDALKVNSSYGSMAMSPCRRWVAAGGMFGTVVVFNIEKLGCVGDKTVRPDSISLDAQNGEVNGISWSDHSIATCADDGTVRVWCTDIM